MNNDTYVGLVNSENNFETMKYFSVLSKSKSFSISWLISGCQNACSCCPFYKVNVDLVFNCIELVTIFFKHR